MRLALIFLALLVGATFHVAGAGVLYQWKDESGRVHFTDDKSKVPAKFRKNSSRDVKPLEAMKNQGATTAGKKYLNGQALYESKCASCHVLGFSDEGSREALGWAIINIDTKYPNTEEDLFNRLRYVVDGGIDMSIVEIDDAELMAITRYLIKASNPK